MLHLLCPLVVCGECPESGSSGLGVATSIAQLTSRFHHDHFTSDIKGDELRIINCPKRKPNLNIPFHPNGLDSSESH